MSERPPILMVRRGSFLAPLAPADSAALEKLPAGKRLKVKVTQPRSLLQHRLYFTMLDLVADNLDQDVTGDHLHEWMKLKVGCCKPVKQRNGEIVWVPGSIAFEKMGQPEFQAFFDKAKRLLVEHIIPGLRSEDLEREARLMLGEAA